MYIYKCTSYVLCKLQRFTVRVTLSVSLNWKEEIEFFFYKGEKTRNFPHEW